MKCDELKVHKAYNRWIDEEMPTPNDDLICNEVYLKDEVDAVIAELKQKLEDAKATAYAESVDAGMRERRLKRALWLAREQTAIEKHNHFALCHNHSTDLYLCINGASIPTEKSTTMRLSSEWSMIWKNVVAKCRAKAEEYK